MISPRELVYANNSDNCPEEVELDDFYDYLFIFAVVLIAAWILFTGYLLRNFIKLKRDCTLLRNRFVTFIYLQILGAAFQVVWAIKVFIPRDELPCAVHVTFPLSIMALQAMPFVIRLLLFHNRILLNQLLARSILLKGTKGRVSFSELISATNMSMFERQENTSSQTSKPASTENLSGVAGMFKVQYARVILINKIRFFSSTRFGVLIYIFGVLGWVAFSVFEEVELKGCVSCSAKEFKYIEIFITAVIILVVTFVLIYRIRHEPDPMRIKEDLMFLAVSAFFGMIFWVLAVTDPSGIEAAGKFEWMLGWFICGFFLVYGLLGLPVWLLRVGRQNILEMDNQATNSLMAILKSTAGRDLLQVQMMNELNVEHFFFYLEATAWKKMFLAKNPDHVDILLVQGDIISKYFEKDAPFSINVGHYERREVLETKDTVDEAIFDKALSSVGRLIICDVLPRFKATKAYKEVFLFEQP